MEGFELSESMERHVKQMIHPTADYDKAEKEIHAVLFMRNRVQKTGMLSFESIAIILHNAGFDTYRDLKEDARTQQRAEEDAAAEEVADEKKKARTVAKV